MELMEIYQTPEEKRLEMALLRVEKIKKYYSHLFVYAIGLVIYVAKSYFGAPLNFFPFTILSEFVLWCWTFIIVIKTLKLFFAEKIFGESWEQRKINEILKKENQSKNRWE